jgi:N-methylhydantoinase A
MQRKVKIGIDVGGTFTHAVAVDASSLELLGKEMVPTTHAAAEGVARGVVDSLNRLLAATGIQPAEVALIAHSTTQATNALLEGDVAPVGIIGLGTGVEGWVARRQTDLGSIELAPGKFLRTSHRFLDTAEPVTAARVQTAVRELQAAGAEVFVVSEAFGVDDQANETAAVEVIRGMGLPATAASEISQLYGLRVRTRTAVLNASMLPKMLETADMTESSVRAGGITAPLMIMRSDGGIMDIGEMRRRPILTMLSGPAAGVAAALMYVKISDGLFLEVGGTSTDISLIRNGRPLVRSAEIGGHRLYVKTLDVRTVGIGGGSMVRRSPAGEIVDVGPRSAHIAGLAYPSFANPAALEGLQSRAIEPRPGDPNDYLAVQSASGARFALTTTEAANALGCVRQYAVADRQSLDRFMNHVARDSNTTVDSLATTILRQATAKVNEVVRQFLREYAVEDGLVSYVGGGGGAEVIVPFAAKEMGMTHFIAENTEVVSAIGAALGMIRDSIERSIVSPSDADILRIRTEAFESVVRMGAAPDSVEVTVEVDTKQKRLVATAMGTPEMRARELTAARLEEGLLHNIVADSCGVPVALVRPIAATKVYTVFQGKKERSRFFGLLRQETAPVRVIDREGVVRLKIPHATARAGSVSTIFGLLGELIDELTVFGDAGGLHPDVFCIVSGRIIDLSGLVSKEQILSLLRVELERFAADEPAIALVSSS